ncbi:MAG: hypothetical protein HZC05_04105, partial [Candidatus Magasanikbacteria bacterium]|nr:hypothetical protein [Candidatus Magasanikbacteria bacterium]
LPPNSDCPRQAYCYENLVKLRQLRILPIGWELAAKASKSDAPTSLQKAVDAFSDSASSFYHLIDPYWILKAPVAKCGAMAFSANFLLPPGADGIGGQRGEYCADVQNCVEEDESGTCNKGNWGYCLKEKNRWLLGADSCDAQFNTCTTYANAKGVFGQHH